MMSSWSHIRSPQVRDPSSLLETSRSWSQCPGVRGSGWGEDALCTCQTILQTVRTSGEILTIFIIICHVLSRAWQYPTVMIVTPSERGEGRSEFTWMLQCDFGGMMPVSLLNLAMPYCIRLFTSSLRKQVVKMQKQKQK